MYFVTLKLTPWWGVAITNSSFCFLPQSPGMGESNESTVLARWSESMILPLGKAEAGGTWVYETRLDHIERFCQRKKGELGEGAGAMPCNLCSHTGHAV